VTASFVSLAGALVLVFWALGAYNRLVGLRACATQHLQALLELWQAQAQTVRTRLAPYWPADTSDATPVLLDQETQDWRLLALSAQQFMACCEAINQNAKKWPTAVDIASVGAARQIFETSWQRLSHARADLAGQAVPDDLQMQWSQHELLLRERLQSYAQAAEAYHAAIDQFPALVLARVFKFEKTGSFR
jgi:LemA protein